MPSTVASPANAAMVASAAPGVIRLTVSGDWSLRSGLPSLVDLNRLLQPPAAVRSMVVEASGLRRWDSALMSFLFAAAQLCRERGITPEFTSLPADARRLMQLATATPGHRRAQPQRPFVLARIGTAIVRKRVGLVRAIAFVGATVIAFARLLRGRARYRRAELALAIDECGPRALPIVSVISLLVGMIFAFVGAIQLKQFGADIYDANLVAVAMTREMASVMTAVVLAGRTGAAFAAHIGAMQENEEIDALATLGLSPMEFLVLPRTLALTLMTPLLSVYAIVLGILGGFLVAVNVLDVTAVAYLVRTRDALHLGDFGVSLVKAAVFGWLVAVAGCYFGVHSGRSASAVGKATTSAVVTGILAIIVADAIFAVVLNALGI